MMSEKKVKYPFLIANTDDSDKNGTHWWSMLNIEFNTFCVDGLKSFIIQDDKK